MHAQHNPDGASRREPASPAPEAQAAAASETERFQELGGKILAQLGIDSSKFSNLRQQIRLAVLGALEAPEGSDPAEFAEIAASLRLATVEALGEFSKAATLADKVSLAFSAFDRDMDSRHQTVALESLDKSSHRSATILTLLKARDLADPQLLVSLDLLGRMEPLLQPLAAAYILHSEGGAKLAEGVKHVLGEERFEALQNLEVEDRGRPLDAREILTELAPTYGEDSLTRPKLLELGRYWADAEEVPVLANLDAKNALQMLNRILQYAAQDVELGACVAGALVAQHKADLIKLGHETATRLLTTFDPELGQTFEGYFQKLKEHLKGKS